MTLGASLKRSVTCAINNPNTYFHLTYQSQSALFHFHNLSLCYKYNQKLKKLDQQQRNITKIIPHMSCNYRKDPATFESYKGIYLGI